MFKLHHLRDFSAIAEAGSVRGAARRLNLAQPALTRSLRELERDLGAALVERHARGVYLTPTGQAFLARTRVVLDELRRGREEAAQLAGRAIGSVTVGVSSGALLALVPDAYKAFRQSHPSVRVRLVEAMYPIVEPQLREGRVDFYVGPRPRLVGDALRMQVLFANERLVVARRGHPLRNARTLRTLVNAQWVLTGLRERAEEEFEEQFAAHGLRPPEAITQADSTLAILTMLAASDAFALLPRQWAETPLFRDLLVPIRVREALTGPDIVLIQRAALPLTPAAERFSNLIQRSATHYATRRRTASGAP